MAIINNKEENLHKINGESISSSTIKNKPALEQESQSVGLQGKTTDLGEEPKVKVGDPEEKTGDKPKGRLNKIKEKAGDKIADVKKEFYARREAGKKLEGMEGKLKKLIKHQDESAKEFNKDKDLDKKEQFKIEKTKDGLTISIDFSKVSEKNAGYIDMSSLVMTANVREIQNLQREIKEFARKEGIEFKLGKTTLGNMGPVSTLNVGFVAKAPPEHNKNKGLKVKEKLEIKKTKNGLSVSKSSKASGKNGMDSSVAITVNKGPTEHKIDVPSLDIGGKRAEKRIALCFKSLDGLEAISAVPHESAKSDEGVLASKELIYSGKVKLSELAIEKDINLSASETNEELLNHNLEKLNEVQSWERELSLTAEEAQYSNPEHGVKIIRSKESTPTTEQAESRSGSLQNPSKEAKPASEQQKAEGKSTNVFGKIGNKISESINNIRAKQQAGKTLKRMEGNLKKQVKHLEKSIKKLNEAKGVKKKDQFKVKKTKGGFTISKSSKVSEKNADFIDMGSGVIITNISEIQQLQNKIRDFARENRIESKIGGKKLGDMGPVSKLNVSFTSKDPNYKIDMSKISSLGSGGKYAKERIKLCHKRLKGSEAISVESNELDLGAQILTSLCEVKLSELAMKEEVKLSKSETPEALHNQNLNRSQALDSWASEHGIRAEKVQHNNYITYVPKKVTLGKKIFNSIDEAANKVLDVKEKVTGGVNTVKSVASSAGKGAIQVKNKIIGSKETKTTKEQAESRSESLQDLSKEGESVSEQQEVEGKTSLEQENGVENGSSKAEDKPEGKTTVIKNKVINPAVNFIKEKSPDVVKEKVTGGVNTVKSVASSAGKGVIKAKNKIIGSKESKPNAEQAESRSESLQDSSKEGESVSEQQEVEGKTSLEQENGVENGSSKAEDKPEGKTTVIKNKVINPAVNFIKEKSPDVVKEKVTGGVNTVKSVASSAGKGAIQVKNKIIGSKETKTTKEQAESRSESLQDLSKEGESVSEQQEVEGKTSLEQENGVENGSSKAEDKPEGKTTVIKNKVINPAVNFIKEKSPDVVKEKATRGVETVKSLASSAGKGAIQVKNKIIGSKETKTTKEQAESRSESLQDLSKEGESVSEQQEVEGKTSLEQENGVENGSSKAEDKPEGKTTVIKNKVINPAVNFIKEKSPDVVKEKATRGVETVKSLLSSAGKGLIQVRDKIFGPKESKSELGVSEEEVNVSAEINEKDVHAETEETRESTVLDTEERHSSHQPNNNKSEVRQELVGELKASILEAKANLKKVPQNEQRSASIQEDKNQENLFDTKQKSASSSERTQKDKLDLMIPKDISESFAKSIVSVEEKDSAVQPDLSSTQLPEVQADKGGGGVGR